MGVLSGKVVLVTGGGNGIGRECALIAAREGAKVVVNDLGSSLSGTDEGSAGPAETVAREIIAAGGEAVSNSESVTSYASVQGMVQQALDAFGGLHAVIAVHMRGTFNVCRATIEHFREQQDGAYVLFTSTSGLLGNIGQANYGAAKMGIAGLSRIIGMEGAAKNVRSNVIAPVAWTRMTQSVPVKDEAAAERRAKMAETIRADQPAILSVALCADDAKHVSGQIFGARGDDIQLYSQPRPIMNLNKEEGWSPTSIIAECFPQMQEKFYSVIPNRQMGGPVPVQAG